MPQVGLVRISVFTPFTSYLAEGGCPVERQLTAAGIEPGLLRRGEDLFPVQWACDFVDRIGRAEGIDGLGLEVGARTSIASLGMFGSFLAQSLTLKDLLDRLFIAIPAADSGAKVWVEPGTEPETIKLCLRHEVEDGRAIADGYALLILIDAVRMACGPDWRPKRFWLSHAAGGRASAFDALSEGGRNVRLTMSPLRSPCGF